MVSLKYLAFPPRTRLSNVSLIVRSERRIFCRMTRSSGDASSVNRPSSSTASFRRRLSVGSVTNCFSHSYSRSNSISLSDRSSKKRFNSLAVTNTRPTCANSKPLRSAPISIRFICGRIFSIFGTGIPPRNRCTFNASSVSASQVEIC